jgi:hypothetical protein
MDVLISTIGLAGAWLLLAGSIYQAVLELRAHELAVDRLEKIGAATRTQRVSSWWWLVPPIKIYLERQRAIAQRPLYMSELTVEEFESMVSYINKATGWFLVAVGGFSIATKETYQFCRERHFAALVFAPIVVALAGLCLWFTRIRTSSSDQLLAKKRDDAGASPAAAPPPP